MDSRGSCRVRTGDVAEVAGTQGEMVEGLRISTGKLIYVEIGTIKSLAGRWSLLPFALRCKCMRLTLWKSLKNRHWSRFGLGILDFGVWFFTVSFFQVRSAPP